MSYQSLYRCDAPACAAEAQALYPEGRSNSPELPKGWWVLRQSAASPATFCGLPCVTSWTKQIQLARVQKE